MKKLTEFIIILIMTIVSTILLIKDYGSSSDIILSACSINSYLNCEITQNSSFSHFLGVPISYLGVIVSLLLLFCVSFSVDLYKKASPFILLNGGLSIMLFLYSLIVLQGFCPFCLVYQLCSITLLFFVILNEELELDFSYVLKFGLILGILFIIPVSKVNYKKVSPNSITRDELLISILEKKTKIGEPLIDSKFWLMLSTERFLDAKIRISIFSDFQCPACRKMSEDFGSILEEYEGDINLQYINYPLDSTCNKNISVPMHPQACLLSKIFICSNDKLYTYKDLFNLQSVISDELLEIYVEEYGLTSCIGSPETERELQNQIQQGVYANVEATPTIVINGLKFEGLLKPDVLKKILDYYKNK